MIKKSYVQYLKGHKNSQGELSEWVIKQHDTGKILSSHKTKEDAEKHLKQIQYFKHKGNLDINKEKVIDFFKSNKAPIPDEKFHEFAEEIGIPPEQAENIAYELLSSVLSEGISEGQSFDYDENEMKMGIKVEMEHTDSPEIAYKIALDHLKEFPNYYTELSKMENKLKSEENIKKEESYPHEIGQVNMNEDLKDMYKGPGSKNTEREQYFEDEKEVKQAQPNVPKPTDQPPDGTEYAWDDVSKSWVLTFKTAAVKTTWDKGSSWEIREIEGKEKLVRKKQLPNQKYTCGSLVTILSNLGNYKAIIKDFNGESIYNVQSRLDGKFYDVHQYDIVSEDSNIF